MSDLPQATKSGRQYFEIPMRLFAAVILAMNRLRSCSWRFADVNRDLHAFFLPESMQTISIAGVEANRREFLGDTLADGITLITRMIGKKR